MSCLFLILSVLAQEEGNETTYAVTQTSETHDTSGNFNERNQTPAAEAERGSDGNETTIEEDQKEATNETNMTLTTTEIVDFIVTVTPTEATQGDVILTVNVENNGTVPLSNLIPVITGKGFSVYNVVPIEEAAPGKIATSYVLGQFSDPGNITLTIKINGKRITQTVAVEGSAQQSAEELEATKKEALAALSGQIEHLEKNYEQLESMLQEKQDDYVLADVKLDKLKEYIRTAQSRMLAGQVKEANMSIILATTEYADVKNTVEHARKKSFFDKIRNNILLISSLAGAILTLFAFFEFVKRKQHGIYKKIKEFRVDKNTKIEVHKKKEGTKGKSKKKKTTKEGKTTEIKEETKDAPKTDTEKPE